MSTTIIAQAASILAVILPLVGINVGTEALTTTISTIVVLVSAFWTWRERVKRGDVTIAGFRK